MLSNIRQANLGLMVNLSKVLPKSQSRKAKDPVTLLVNNHLPVGLISRVYSSPKRITQSTINSFRELNYSRTQFTKIEFKRSRFKTKQMGSITPH